MEEARCLVVLVLAVTVLATSGAEHEHETLHRERRQAQHDDKGRQMSVLLEKKSLIELTGNRMNRIKNVGHRLRTRIFSREKSTFVL